MQVITGFPCYPAGETYAGYRQRLYDERQVDGVLVTRLPQFTDHSRSIVRRALYYLSFALSVTTIGLWRMRRADVILVYQSALPTALAAWFMSRAKRVPYVLDVADLWPESVAASGMLRHPMLLGIIRACMQFAYRGAARIVVITEGYRDRLLALGVPRDKLALIHYWVPTGQFDPLPSDEEFARDKGLHGRFNVLYSGTMGPVQDLSAVIEAAALVAEELPQVQFVMVGDGLEYESLVALAEQRGASNVRFLGRRSPAEVQRLSAAAHVLLVHLKPDELTRISIPSKTFACFASGRPILMAVEGESSRLVEKLGCGIVATPSNPLALADAVHKLVAMSEGDRERMAQAGRKAHRENYCSEVQVPKFEQLLSETVSTAGRLRLNDAPKRRLKRRVYRRGGKRLADLLIALPMLVIAGPLMLIIALAVRLNLGAPVLFAQDRPGINGRLFKLYKFRTMRDVRDAAGYQLSDSLRLTRFGRFLRATSLDELPELWNVLRGEMSLVGPRPLLPEYLKLYTARHARRHEVRPGITGWAQVNGRNSLAWEERFKRDVWYVDNCSLWLDMRILLETLWQVIRRRGITSPGHVTAEPFTGRQTQHKSSVRGAAKAREKSIIVLGAGGHAKVVISTLRTARWDVEAVYDDDVTKHGLQILGVEIRGSIAELDPQACGTAVIAVGDAQRRRAIAGRFAFNWATIVHPFAWVDPFAKLGPGVVVCAGRGDSTRMSNRSPRDHQYARRSRPRLPNRRLYTHWPRSAFSRWGCSRRRVARWRRRECDSGRSYRRSDDRRGGRHHHRRPTKRRCRRRLPGQSY